MAAAPPVPACRRLCVLMATAAFALSPAAGQPKERPMCQVAEALVGSVDHHLTEWDNQIDIGLNESLNCSMFLEFVYLSRDRIRMQLDYIRGNFSAEEEMLRARVEDAASTTWAMTHMSTAASLVSAHIHIHGVLAAARTDCLSENLQLLFLMSLRRLKALLEGQLRHLWIVFQGTAELFHQGANRWLSELVELFEADLRTMETIMVSWVPPPGEDDAGAGAVAVDDSGEMAAAAATSKPVPGARPGPPLPTFTERETDGVALSTLEILRRDAFDEWRPWKPTVRALLRQFLPRDGHVADFCSGTGQAADFLNDTGLVTAYAYDPSPNIRLLSKGTVDLLRAHAEPVQLWRSFDVLLCLPAHDYFARSGEEAWSQLWRNIEAHASLGAVVGCGSGETRQAALSSVKAAAPSLVLDDALSESLDASAGLHDSNRLCAFRRQGQAQ